MKQLTFIVKIIIPFLFVYLSYFCANEAQKISDLQEMNGNELGMGMLIWFIFLSIFSFIPAVVTLLEIYEELY